MPRRRARKETEAEPEAPTAPVRSEADAGDVAKPAGPARDALAESGAGDQYLTFFLAGEEYGIGILRAREILAYQTLTRVPATPPWIRGVMNLRGNVVPVLDLAIKFGMDATPVTDRTCAIIVEVDCDGEATPMGILADSVHQVVALPPAAIAPPPAFGTRADVGFLAGMGSVEERFVLLLNVDRVLSGETLLPGPPGAVAAPAAEVQPATGGA